MVVRKGNSGRQIAGTLLIVVLFIVLSVGFKGLMRARQAEPSLGLSHLLD